MSSSPGSVTGHCRFFGQFRRPSSGRMASHAFPFSRFLFRRLFLSLLLQKGLSAANLSVCFLFVFFSFSTTFHYLLLSSLDQAELVRHNQKSSTSVSCFASSSMTHFLLQLSSLPLSLFNQTLHYFLFVRSSILRGKLPKH